MKNIALIVGGVSSEREISLKSGYGVYQALKNKTEYNVTVIDPALGINQYDNNDDYFTKKLDVVDKSNFVKTFALDLFKKIDVAFIILHGTYGEDGLIQNIMETLNIKYTGSRAFSCALSMNKKISKIIFEKYGIRTPLWLSFDINVDGNSIYEKIDNEIGYPLIIKPKSEGSSVGMSVCYGQDDLKGCIEKAAMYSNEIIVERFIKGREFTVGVLGDKVLPPLEIKPKHDFYDYECKYTKGMTEYIVPADIPKQLTNKLQHLALQAVKSIDAFGFPRVDFIVDNNDEPYILEINALPGLTETSLFPKMANAVGISYEQLVEEIIKLAY